MPEPRESDDADYLRANGWSIEDRRMPDIHPSRSVKQWYVTRWTHPERPGKAYTTRDALAAQRRAKA